MKDEGKQLERRKRAATKGLVSRFAKALATILVKPKVTKLELEDANADFYLRLAAWVTPNVELRKFKCKIIKDNVFKPPCFWTLALIDLLSQVVWFWDLKSEGKNSEKAACDEGTSDLTQQKFNESVKFNNCRYEVALPWKLDCVKFELQNNVKQARKR
ncbi:hypothetical protein Pcinc_014320 [Petrolisthes cinctipes]|uniref:Uncharacterized protein n=1 Tax=Petrolisthes cinctipes TaxID=88211 RepID=A0AAE1G0J8_PETCI|nr:hypothetical protein Pcinc_014320 [Petrolisthes cinctipes]